MLRGHAETELKAFGALDGEALYGGMIGRAVLKLIDVFAEQGHSGQSAAIVIEMFARLARLEPLGPLTGADDEWVEVGPGVFQNKRCCHVFKEKGAAYDIDGIVWEDPDGSRFTNIESRVPVTFPYTPKSEIRKRA